MPRESVIAAAISALATSAPITSSLAQAFKSAGYTLALVGGPVRDAILGRLGNDLDFTTNARPAATKAILANWGDAVWDQGAAFGTVAAKKGETTVEVTTYRSDTYSSESRKPEVDFGNSIIGDLGRRDFTVNAMALELTTVQPEFIDPFDGITDLAKKILRTPGRATDSFSDDPLRMMRAARFMSQLDFAVDPEVIDAMRAMAERITIVSAERVRVELIKILMSTEPRLGLTLLVDSGIADYVLPELPMLKLEIEDRKSVV